jgi:uncharacterized protein YndB with AHSA1/START domain
LRGKKVVFKVLESTDDPGAPGGKWSFEGGVGPDKAVSHEGEYPEVDPPRLLCTDTGH